MVQTAYDIIKAHGGEIKVNTEEGIGSEFIIQLPVVWTEIWGDSDNCVATKYK